MRIINDPKLDFSDVLIVPKRSELSSRKEVDITRRFDFKHSGGYFQGVPIISANMDTISTFEMARALNEHAMCSALHKHYSEDELVEFFEHESGMHFYSIGVREEDLEKFYAVNERLSVPIMHVCIDVANGYSERFIDFVKHFREMNPEVTIMAGNVVTADVTEQLILAGADIVKVGIGPGSVCTTRKMTGVGYPQLSAVIECADAAHGLGGLVCSDGGCQLPGDLAKAFGAGADFVMLGGMLAGHSECGGEVTDVNGNVVENNYPYNSHKLYMKFYGMSSKEAQMKHHGGVAEYRASEGKSVLVPYRGSVENTVKEILGGLRSACTYVGAKQLKELSKRTTFIMVNRTHNKVYGDE